jgi:hypothetical protein
MRTMMMMKLDQMSRLQSPYASFFANKLLYRYVVESIRSHLVDEDVSFLTFHTSDELF